MRLHCAPFGVRSLGILVRLLAVVVGIWSIAAIAALVVAGTRSFALTGSAVVVVAAVFVAVLYATRARIRPTTPYW